MCPCPGTPGIPGLGKSPGASRTRTCSPRDGGTACGSNPAAHAAVSSRLREHRVRVRVRVRSLLSRMVCCKASVFSLLCALSSLPARGGVSPSVLPHPYRNLLAGNPLEESFALNCKFREGMLPSASQGCRVFKRQQIPNGCISGVSSNIRCDASGWEITGNPTHADFSLKKICIKKCCWLM